MAGSSSTEFEDFYKDLKETEKKDAVLTSAQQIERLLRPGSTYRNLNPYEVLMIEPETPMDEVRKKYRRMSILVHPDKNRDQPERAQAAFDALKKAFEVLENEETRKKCLEIVEEAHGRTKMAMEEKRKSLKKQGKEPIVEEDNPEKYKQAVKTLTMKLFAELERKRRINQQKVSEEAARKREAEKELEEKKNLEKEFAKNWEESRQGRVNSWLSFTKGKAGPEKKKKEKRFSPMGFKPPKHKPEAR